MADIRTGKPHSSTDKPAHVPGVRQGNHPYRSQRHPGHLSGRGSTARRSTGICARSRNPILPGMPNISPA